MTVGKCLAGPKSKQTRLGKVLRDILTMVIVQVYSWQELSAGRPHEQKGYLKLSSGECWTAGCWLNGRAVAFSAEVQSGAWVAGSDR